EKFTSPCTDSTASIEALLTAPVPPVAKSPVTVSVCPLRSSNPLVIPIEWMVTGTNSVGALGAAGTDTFVVATGTVPVLQLAAVLQSDVVPSHTAIGAAAGQWMVAPVC